MQPIEGRSLGEPLELGNGLSADPKALAEGLLGETALAAKSPEDRAELAGEGDDVVGHGASAAS